MSAGGQRVLEVTGESDDTEQTIRAGGNVTRGEKCGTYYTAEESQDYQSYSAYGFQEGEPTP